MIGYTSSVMFISEAVMMFLSTYFLKKTQAHSHRAAFFLLFALWQFLYSGMTEAWQVAAAAVLDGPAFAFLSLGILYYVDEIAPPQLRSTYQTLIYSFYFGLSGIIGNVWGGWAVENIGYQPMYLAGDAWCWFPPCCSPYTAGGRARRRALITHRTWESPSAFSLQSCRGPVEPRGVIERADRIPRE